MVRSSGRDSSEKCETPLGQQGKARVEGERPPLVRRGHREWVFVAVTLLLFLHWALAAWAAECWPVLQISGPGAARL